MRSAFAAALLLASACANGGTIPPGDGGGSSSSEGSGATTNSSGGGGENGTGAGVASGGAPSSGGGGAMGNGGAANGGATSAGGGMGGMMQGPVCGDGQTEGAEECDDQDTASGDGCSSTCTIESGFNCDGEPSVCTPVATDQVITVGPGLNLSIPDNGYSGAINSMACATLNVPSVANNTISAVEVEVGAIHGYVGDLVFKLVSPANTVITLVSRPGGTELFDDGTELIFNSGELVASSPITFVTGAATSAEQMGVSTSVICLDNGICDFAPNNGAAPAGNLTTLNGQSAAGAWKFCAGDSAASDAGSIDKVVLTIAH